MSAKTPPTLLRGAAPNTPAKKRVIMIVWRSLAVAVANENSMSANTGMVTEILRP